MNDMNNYNIIKLLDYCDNLSGKKIEKFILQNIEKLNEIIKNMCKLKDTYVILNNLIYEMYCLNKYKSICKFMNLITSNPDWDSNLFDIYTNSYYSNDELYKNIQMINSKIDNDDEYKAFIKKILDNFAKKNQKKNNLLDKIVNKKNKIINILSIPIQIKIKEKVIVLKKTTFDILIENISEKEYRTKIYKLYNDVDGVIGELGQIFVLKNLYYNQLKEDACVEFTHVTDNSLYIKKFISILNNEINPMIGGFIKSLNKPNTADIIYNLTYENITTTFDKIIDNIFLIGKKLFNLTFNVTQQDIYICNEDNYQLGYLYIKHSNKIEGIINVNITHKYKILNNNTLTNIILVTNYNKNSQITIKQAIEIFKEFSYVFRNMIYRSKVGLLNNTMTDLFPFIMEYSFWDNFKNVFCVTDKEYYINKKLYKIKLCLDLKQESVYALFDIMCHYSKSFIKILYDLFNNNKIDDAKKYITSEYAKIYDNIFENMLNDNFITNDLIIGLLNDNGDGIMYTKIVNRIFGYIVYCKLKINNELYKNFYDGCIPFKMIIKKIVSEGNFDMFIKYIYDQKDDDCNDMITNSYIEL